ncbi:MAG: hypothetical protein ACMUJM_15635 [bacterium]
MILHEIIQACGGLEVEEKRRSSDEYIELVFLNKELDQWITILTEILGPPIKPAGVKPTKNDLLITQAYGGIFRNQTLFRKKSENGIVIVMLWPWQDTVHVTLKMALIIL